MTSPKAQKSLPCSIAALVAVTVGLLISAPVNSQVAGATLAGTVTDGSGAVVPNANISINNPATGITRDVRTDGAGFYSAPNLSPGSYDVTDCAPGFFTQAGTVIPLAEWAPK